MPERLSLREFIRQLLSRDSGPFAQFCKYAIAGGIATVVHVGIFHLLAWKVFPALEPEDLFIKVLGLSAEAVTDVERARNSMLSNVSAFVVANLICWLINRAWVFKPGRHHVLVELGLFYAASGLAIAIGTVLMGWLINQFGMLTTYAFGANLVTSLMINYAVRKFVIFRG